MGNRSLPVGRIVTFTILAVIAVLAVIFLMEDPATDFAYPVR